jgi:hypothetical protein
MEQSDHVAVREHTIGCCASNFRTIGRRRHWPTCMLTFPGLSVGRVCHDRYFHLLLAGGPRAEGFPWRPSSRCIAQVQRDPRKGRPGGKCGGKRSRLRSVYEGVAERNQCEGRPFTTQGGGFRVSRRAGLIGGSCALVLILIYLVLPTLLFDITEGQSSQLYYDKYSTHFGCFAVCVTTSNCVGFMLHDQQCHLYSTISRMEPRKDCFSGIRRY